MADGDVVWVEHPGHGRISADPVAMHEFCVALERFDLTTNAAGHGVAEAIAAFNASPSDVGGRIDPEAWAAVDAAIDGVTYLDAWVDRVGQAFATVGPGATSGAITFSIGPADLVAATRDGYTLAGTEGADDGIPGVEVRWERDDPSATRVLVVTVDRADHSLSLQEWLLICERYGLDPATGMEDVMVHGLATSGDDATAAGLAQADTYDSAGVEGVTVVVVDWEEHGRFTFHAAQDDAAGNGETVEGLLTFLGWSDPGGRINLTNHSLGNDVSLRALATTPLADDDAAIDLLMINPAIDSDFAADPAYDGALDQADRVTVLVNPDDSALAWYERVVGDGDEALGDDDAATATAALADGGADGPVTVVQHTDDHASLNPSKSEPVADVQAQRADEGDTPPTEPLIDPVISGGGESGGGSGGGSSTFGP